VLLSLSPGCDADIRDAPARHRSEQAIKPATLFFKDSERTRGVAVLFAANPHAEIKLLDVGGEHNFDPRDPADW
jgi:hypothetical protein